MTDETGKNASTECSASPDRGKFQLKGYLQRCSEENRDPDPNYLKIFELQRQKRADYMAQRDHKNDLEWDLRTTEWVLSKVRGSKTYAQNLYAALCNNEFQRKDVMPILKDERWSCTWRYSGGIIADMLEEGDYIDWYCSGMGGVAAYDDDEIDHGCVGEGYITEEITQDLDRLGWMVVTDDPT